MSPNRYVTTHWGVYKPRVQDGRVLLDLRSNLIGQSATYRLRERFGTRVQL